MSQFRAEDISGQNTSEAKSPRDLHQNPSHSESLTKSESQDITHPPHSFVSNPIRSEYSDEYISKSLSNEYPQSKQVGIEYSQKPNTEFPVSKQLETYHSKQLLAENERTHPTEVDENYTISKVEIRHGHTASPISFPGQPRFLSGQSISQTAGPTPTLNQLLQASSPVHRFHNYPSIGTESYQQSWPLQRPSVVPPVYPQPNQRPPQTGSPRSHHGPGGTNSPTLTYQSYSQRFSSPNRSHSPYSHQLNSYTVTSGHSSNLYAEQRNWSQTNSLSATISSSTNQSNTSGQSPQRALSQSPAPQPSASPQPQTSNQPQSFHGIQQRSTTPNAQGIDSGELSGQNSNDSSNGPAGPATPNSQGMRPTPSPTGSTGSRSMSPAVGQQSVQMPPRPSSSQSDGGSTARVSLSPLATQVSGDDSSFAPKVRKELMSYHSHPATPQSTVPSPGAASINSVHEDYSDMNSPGWPRTPSSPVYNTHVNQDPYRSKKSDSLSKLYEMDDSIERRSWLDKLVGFMEDRRTPITSCPTISKNPLDLFRLYLYVKERGGFMEVTKNKTWKDIAGLLGIGASSSAAYTLRKHYTKHLLAFECYFDRGGVDPQPIINQVEAGTKKKGSKGTSSIPSPGSSNSQDSFPAGSSNNTSVDSYGNYSNNFSGNTTSGQTADYVPPPPRPPSQSSSSHSNLQQSNYQNSSSFQNYSSDQYNRPQGNVINQQNEYNQPYSARPHYPPYVSDIDRNYAGNNLAPNSPSQDIYSRYSGSQPSGIYSSGTTSNSRNTYTSTSQGHSNSSQQSVSSHQITSQSQSNTGSTYSCSQDYYRQDQVSYGPSLGNQTYTNTATASKTMPPPAGPQQPRRHPDFVKEQTFSTYNQRTVYSGWSTNPSQYGSSGIVRMSYPNQQSQSSQQHQQTQSTQINVSTPVSSTVGLNNNHQWNNQQNTRSNSQASVNTLLHGSSPWDQRYNQTSTLYTSSSSNQNQLGISSALNQQSIIKREMTFPSDCVEGITPLSYKRRKLTRSDIAPVEAWRIMMALRSGLLAESCWALDVLNILLFDDSSVHYFGLSHLPGLLDILLEHFSRSLSDMFESSLVSEDYSYYQRSIQHSGIDLGAVINPVDPDDRIKLLSSSNYTYTSRRGKIVKIIPRDDDIFILDNQRSWDQQNKETEIEPWHIDSDAINYIVTCFESEINNVSFTNHFKTEELSISQKNSDYDYSKDKMKSSRTEKFSNSFQDKLLYDPYLKQSETPLDSKQQHQEKKKKLKTLSDVISRIKKEPIEMNDLTREIFEKKYDGSKKDGEIYNSNSINFAEHLSIEISKPNEVLYSEQSNLQNATIDNEKRKETKNCQIEHDNKKIDEATKSNEQNEYDLYEKSLSFNEQEISKLKVRDPAGTLKRKKISDYEDESYSRDEASLYLITETQDNLARRCVCLSTILRNLTFIPGNELEFAKNITFLSLLGKLLLLHHEHPTRAQKTRNYDREEDADFADSCSSLQGENEWWWDFLYHIRENILVMAANISGYIDLSQYPEEISRPVLDGLLHWAICPAAHGQDPFPTVSYNSSLSPQRLALEALCKLCVTESNVDLVVATPPYSRIQKLCSVLSRLLCRSEEQVLREFGVNLLYFLSAADSGIARTIALQTPCVALLVAFIEQAENSALNVANQHGIAALRDNPESMGTSLDMLRRAAGALLNLSRHPDNRALLLQHESRLLALVMSQILDQQVAAIVARVLFQCSRGTT